MHVSACVVVAPRAYTRGAGAGAEADGRFLHSEPADDEGDLAACAAAEGVQKHGEGAARGVQASDTDCAVDGEDAHADAVQREWMSGTSEQVLSCICIG